MNFGKKRNVVVETKFVVKEAKMVEQVENNQKQILLLKSMIVGQVCQEKRAENGFLPLKIHHPRQPKFCVIQF